MVGPRFAFFGGVNTKVIVTVSTLAALLGACGGTVNEGMTSFGNDDGIDVSGLDDGSGGIDDGGADDGAADDGANDGGADDDGGLDGGADDGGNGADCVSEQFEVGAQPPAVMLVLDKSGSMSDERWVHNGQLVTRWASLHSVVSDLVSTYDSTINFGATLFPSVDSDDWQEGYDAACTVRASADVPPMGNAANEILAAMPSADATVRGATPARAGILTAVAELSQQPDTHPRAALLVTDGLANCGSEDQMLRYDDELPGVVASAYDDHGIPTYVVGIDIRDEHVDYADANAHEVLREVARSGGVPRDGDLPYYAASDEAALYDALDEIAARIECTIPLTQAVPQDADFEVKVGDTVLNEVDNCSTDSGWRFTDAAQRSTIELCGLACDGVRAEGEFETTTCEADVLVPQP